MNQMIEKVQALGEAQVSRRSAMKRMFLGGAGLAAGLTVLGAKPAHAMLLPKAAVHYQDKPSAGSDCSTCSHFVPGSSNKGFGKCNVVAGKISPEGWCVVYS